MESYYGNANTYDFRTQSHTHTHGYFRSFNVKLLLFYIFCQHYVNDGYNIVEICEHGQYSDTMFALNYHMNFCLLFPFHALSSIDSNAIFDLTREEVRNLWTGFFLVYLEKNHTKERTIQTHIFLNLKPSTSFMAPISSPAYEFEQYRMRIVCILYLSSCRLKTNWKPENLFIRRNMRIGSTFPTHFFDAFSMLGSKIVHYVTLCSTSKVHAYTWSVVRHIILPISVRLRKLDEKKS